jgi:hypothetical protein
MCWTVAVPSSHFSTMPGRVHGAQKKDREKGNHLANVVDMVCRKKFSCNV